MNTEEGQKQQQRSGNKNNWMKVIIILLIVLAVSIAASIGLVTHFRGNQNKKNDDIQNKPLTRPMVFASSLNDPSSMESCLESDDSDLPTAESPQRLFVEPPFVEPPQKFTENVVGYTGYSANIHPLFDSDRFEYFEIRGNDWEFTDNLIEHLRQYPVVSFNGKVLEYPNGILQDYRMPKIFFHGTNKVDPWGYKPWIAEDLWLTSLTQQNQRSFVWPLSYSGRFGWIIIFELIGYSEGVRIQRFDSRYVPPYLRDYVALVGRTGYCNYSPSDDEIRNGFNWYVHPDAYICTERCMEDKRGRWKILRAYKRVENVRRWYWS